MHFIRMNILHTVIQWRKLNAYNNTIELTVHTSCYWGLLLYILMAYQCKVKFMQQTKKTELNSFIFRYCFSHYSFKKVFHLRVLFFAFNDLLGPHMFNWINIEVRTSSTTNCLTRLELMPLWLRVPPVSDMIDRNTLIFTSYTTFWDSWHNLPAH